MLLLIHLIHVHRHLGMCLSLCGGLFLRGGFLIHTLCVNTLFRTDDVYYYS
jgi:hypothetical protein